MKDAKTTEDTISKNCEFYALVKDTITLKKRRIRVKAIKADLAEAAVKKQLLRNEVILILDLEDLT